ncbi:MAG: ABC transporter substrate-binding protein [Thermomicrobiales bacterium]
MSQRDTTPERSGKVSRRAVLRLRGGAGGVVFLAAWGNSATPTTTRAPSGRSATTSSAAASTAASTTKATTSAASSAAAGAASSATTSSATTKAASTAATTTTAASSTTSAASGSATAAASPAGNISTEIQIVNSGVKLPTDKVTFRWVDSGDQKAVFWKQYFDLYQKAHPNITVQYSPLPWNEIAKVVPAGIQGGNAPDVFQIPQNVPNGQAVTEGWVAPLDDLIPNFKEWKASFPPGAFVNGITDFNGKTYMIPLTSNARYGTLTLYNVELLQKAGVDPGEKPLNWDDFRAVLKKLTQQGAGKYYGLIFGGNQTGRFSDIVGNLAGMAGASSLGDIDLRTGEYVYTADQYLAATELLLAIKSDGSIFPGVLSINAPQARAQFPNGAAGIILQGPWNIPGWQQDNPGFKFGVGSSPIPNDGKVVPLTHGPGGSNPLWIYSKSKLKEIGADIFHYAGTLQGQTAWGTTSDGADAPIFPEANKYAKLDPLARKAQAFFDDQIRLGPDPRVRNPDAQQVYLEMKHLNPDFGQTLQGIYTGQLKDPKTALKDLQDRASAELDRSIKAAQAKGAKVSRDDWKFSNWDPTKDYTEADYKAAQ